MRLLALSIPANATDGSSGEFPKGKSIVNILRFEADRRSDVVLAAESKVRSAAHGRRQH
jgi:hypothetical protein